MAKPTRREQRVTSNDVNQAVILAAGEGTRLGPLTKDFPKPLLPIKNKPVIHHVIDILGAAGIQQLNIVIGYKAEKIRSYLNSVKLKANINYAYQPEALGSGDALLCARKLIDKDRPFLVTAADTVFKAVELKKMIDVFRQEKPDAIVALRLIDRNELIRRSCVHLNPDGSIKHLIEKPMPRELPLHNMSVLPVFMFSNNFWRFFDKLKPSAEGYYQIATAIQDCIDSGGLVKGFEFKFSQDLTYPQDILRHNFDYLNKL